MSESRHQNSLSNSHEEQKISDNQSFQEDSKHQNKLLSKPLGRPRGRGRPKLNPKIINKKKQSQEQIEEQIPKVKEKATPLKQQNQIEGYVRIVDFLKKIDCDQISFQNKMNPYHSLTASCFWYMISAEYYSYDFYARKNPSEAANAILNRVGKLPVQIPMRFIKNTHQDQLLQFETQQVRKLGQNISQLISQLVPNPNSLSKTQNIQKRASLTTVSQDNQFISSTRAILFNYVKGKFQKSQKWASNIKSKLQNIQILESKQFIRTNPIKFQQKKQQIIDSYQLDILSRQAKRRKSQKRKSQIQINGVINQQKNDQHKDLNNIQNENQDENKIIEQCEDNINQNIDQNNQNDVNEKEKIQEIKKYEIQQQFSQQNSEQVNVTKKITSDEVLLSSILHMPLQKTISILESTLHKSSYMLPQIQPTFMPIPKNDPLDFVFQLHQQEQKYLEYMKQYKKKIYRNKVIKNEHIIQQEQRQTQFQDAKCQICTDGDYTDDNLIVFCSKCNISLHQRCVGLAKVPAESWVCDICLSFGPAGINVPCPLCNIKGGALKRTSIHIDNPLFKQLNTNYYEYAKKCPYNKQKQQYINQNKVQHKIQQNQEKQDNDSKQQKDQLYYDYFNKNSYPNDQPNCHYIWVHYVCAIWIPQCYFEQKNGSINIKGIQNIQKRRFKHQCTVCKKVKSGACVKCDDPQCRKYYHPQCARKKKVYMEQLNLQKIKYLIFCQQHQPLKITRQIEYKKKKNRDQIIKFARMIEKYVETYKIAFFPHKLMKIIPTKSFIQTFQKDQKEQSVIPKQQIPKQTDQEFFKDIIIRLSKAKKITVTVIKTQTGFKISQMHQPSRRQMRKCLNRYDDFWHTIQNNQSVEQNWRRYQRIMKENIFLKEKMQIFLNGGSLANPYNQGNLKPKKGKARGKNVKVQQQTLIEEEGGIFCICRKPYQNQLDMFQCQICSQWYHYRCIGFIGSEQDAQTIQFHCMKCMKFQTQQQKRPRLQKCIKYFSTDSLFLNYRPPTPQLMSEEEQQIKSHNQVECQSIKKSIHQMVQNSDLKQNLKQNTQINLIQNNKQQNKQQEAYLSHTTLKAKKSNKSMISEKSQDQFKSQIQRPKLKIGLNFESHVNPEKASMQTTITKFLGLQKKQKITNKIQDKLAQLQKSFNQREYQQKN